MEKSLKANKIFTILIVMLPFLSQYKSIISVISLGEFLLVPFILVAVISQGTIKVEIKRFNGLYIYFMLSVTMTVFAALNSFFSFKDFLTIFARLIFYGILIYIAYNNFELETASKACIGLATIFCIYAIIQYFTHLFSGIILPTVLNSKWVFGAEAGSRLNYMTYYKYTYRSSSLFLEPSYLASFCGPALPLLLFNGKANIKKITLALIITIGLIISTSSAGFIIFSISWGYYLWKEVLFNNTHKLNIKKLLCTIFILLIIVGVLLGPMGSTLWSRTFSGGSFNNRITRSWILIKSLNFYQKLFGIGLNNLENYVIATQNYTIYDETNLNYVNTFSGTIIFSGIFTFISYLAFYIKTWKKNNNCFVRVLLIILLFLAIIGNVTFNSKFAYYVIFLFAIQKKYNSRKNI